MIKKDIIINKTVSFINEKLTELSNANPLIMFARPIISRAANNMINKMDSILSLIEDKDGMVDIEGILTETIDNILVAQVKKYPDLLGGIELGNGTIKVNIPGINKAIMFDHKDIEYFKEYMIK